MATNGGIVRSERDIRGVEPSARWRNSGNQVIHWVCVGQLVSGAGSCEVPPLGVVDADSAQYCGVLLGFDAFCDNRGAGSVPEVAKRSHERSQYWIRGDP